MKRIAIVITSLNGGGAERVILTLAEELIKLGQHVQILSIQPQCDYQLPKNIAVDFLFQKAKKNATNHWNLKQSVIDIENWFKKQRLAFDLILSNLDEANLLLSRTKLHNIHYIIHRSVEKELESEAGLFRSKLKRSKKALIGQHLICVSNGIEQEINASDWLKPKSCRTIYNPFQAGVILALAEEDNPQIPKEPYIIHVGRVARAKRHELLFEAFQQIDLRYKLVLLCDKPQKALKKADKFGLANRLILPGFQQNPYNWVKQAELLMLSSDYEGFGNVLLESLVVNTPVVSTDCPHGPSEILTGHLSQFLTPCRDATALAKAANLALKLKPKVNDSPIINKTEAKRIALEYLALCDN